MSRKSIILLALAAILSLTAGIGLKAYFFFNPEPETIRERIEHDEETGRINLLLVGLDEVPGEDFNRSDSIAFVSIDIDDKVVRMLSLPRDTRVQIPDRGWQKLNHAYAYGGVDLLKTTLVNYLGVPIPYHVIVNLDSFPELVDLIGGVTINVPKRLRYTDKAGGVHIDIPAGEQHMDGKTALGYVRFRHDALGDIGRVERQQVFMMAVFRKMKDPSMITKVPELIRQSLRLVKTNLTLSQAVQLASYLKDLDPSRTVFRTLPGKSAYISGISYWLGELSSISEILSEKPLETVETEEMEEQAVEADTAVEVDLKELVASIKVPLSVLNGSGASGVGKESATRLQSIGIDVVHIGNAKHYDYKFTNILYPAGEEMEKAARTLGRLAGIPENLVRTDTSTRHVTIIMGHDYLNVLKRIELARNR
ncbi:MAG: LCP family protein [Synergistales bacterium]|nr:LCP family protein [Synergistales bacterium]MDD3829418.1 LCP family protein [Synergistales bacterium]MDD5513864.1 LCP family protein [Synergistales bacterium]NLV65748.1 LCP family protein [Synergistaceae bacterium]